MITSKSATAINLLIIVLVNFLTLIDCGNLFGLTMKPPKANIHLEATLTDKGDNNKKWLLAEDLVGISSSNLFIPHGQIHVTRESQSFDVYYHQSHDDKRLIIIDNDCKQMETSPDLWSLLIPTVRAPLLNLILLTGPSFIYRLPPKSSKWNDCSESSEVQDEGVSMKCRNITLNRTLDIKVYYENDANAEKIIRIDFDGYYRVSGMTLDSKQPESLSMKILNQNQVNDNLEVKVRPKTGIGCPDYFQSDPGFPKLTTRQLHLAVTETLKDMDNIKSIPNIEVYVDSDKKLTRIGVDNLYTINDFNLAVSYVFNSSQCTIQPFNKYVSGLIGGQLDINELTWMNGQFAYVGKTIYEPRAQGIFDTWESVEFKRDIEGIKYDKVVTTQYMAKLQSDQPGQSKNGHVTFIPVAMVRTSYMKDKQGKYFVAESRRRDISEFQRAITKTQYEKLFGISNCFGEDQRMALTFDIRSEDNGYTCNTGTRFAEENIYEFKENFKNLLTRHVSPLRISSIGLDFHIDRISAKVEFLQRPPIEKSLQSKSVNVNVGAKILTSRGIVARNIDECLKTQINGNYFKEILYCPSNNDLCLNIDDLETSTDETDSPMECTSYTYLLTNHHRLSKEIELSDLHKTLIRIENMNIIMKCDNCSTYTKSYRYRVTNILDYSMFDQTTDQKQSFIEVSKSSKLDVNNVKVQLVSGSIRNFDDCYQTCTTDENTDCVAFSYCYNGVSHECATSSALFTPNSTIFSVNCTTYAKNFILNYSKAPNKQFADVQEQISFSTWSADDCASKCSQQGYKSCSSFQYCSNNNLCTLTRSSLTVQKVKHDLNCDVYTRKRSHLFMVTGSTLVSEFIIKESNLDFEQCAALCFSWRAGNESCNSFNYCPKGRHESSCKLTKFKVGNPNIQTISSPYCYNFEMIPGLKQHGAKNDSPFMKNADDDVSKATTSISLAFMVVGLVLGIVITSIYHTVHNRNKYRVTSTDQDSDT